MGAGFVAQQVGIAARENDVDFLPQQPVDKDRPVRQVPHLVNEQMGVIAIHGI